MSLQSSSVIPTGLSDHSVELLREASRIFVGTVLCRKEMLVDLCFNICGRVTLLWFVPVSPGTGHHVLFESIASGPHKVRNAMNERRYRSDSGTSAIVCQLANANCRLMVSGAAYTA